MTKRWELHNFLTDVRNGGGIGNLLSKKFNPVEEVQNVTFSDVIGNEEAKEELQDLVDYLKDPAKFEGVKVPKGVLMVSLLLLVLGLT